MGIIKYMKFHMQLNKDTNKLINEYHDLLQSYDNYGCTDIDFISFAKELIGKFKDFLEKYPNVSPSVSDRFIGMKNYLLNQIARAERNLSNSKEIIDFNNKNISNIKTD